MEITAAATAQVSSLPNPVTAAASVAATPPSTSGNPGANASVAANAVTVTPTAKAKSDNSSGSNSQASKKALDDSVKKINQTVQLFNTSIEFQVDASTNRMVVRIVDTQTNDVVSQIPSEEALQLAQALDKLQGLLVKTKA